MAQNRRSQRAHRDADEEALQAALRASLEPDYMAQILNSESHATPTAAPVAEHRRSVTPGRNMPVLASIPVGEDEDDDDDGSDVLGHDDGSDVLGHGDVDGHTNDSDEEEEEANRHHKLLNFADFVLVDLLRFLDEDSISHCIATCKRLRHVASSDALFETICRRIFTAQCPRVAVAASKNKFTLRKFPSWLEMFQERPRVRHNGFYFLKTSYYKKPELNMWTEIVPGTILQVVYYRYFSFQRDGTVLYSMAFKPPHEASNLLKRCAAKEVWRGTFQVERDQVLVSVPTNHSVVEFKLRISSEGTRGKNVKLVLLEHYSFSEPNRTGWVDQFATFEQEFQFYRNWGL